MFRRCTQGGLLGLIFTAVGIGILAAFMLPIWFLVVFEAVLLVLMGILYIK